MVLFKQSQNCRGCSGSWKEIGRPTAFRPGSRSAKRRPLSGSRGTPTRWAPLHKGKTEEEKGNAVTPVIYMLYICYIYVLYNTAVCIIQLFALYLCTPQAAWSSPPAWSPWTFCSTCWRRSAAGRCSSGQWSAEHCRPLRPGLGLHSTSPGPPAGTPGSGGRWQMCLWGERQRRGWKSKCPLKKSVLDS